MSTDGKRWGRRGAVAAAVGLALVISGCSSPGGSAGEDGTAGTAGTAGDGRGRPGRRGRRGQPGRRESAIVPLIQQRDAAVASLLADYKASPGYDDTGYVDYSTVRDSQRRQLSAAVNALAEALSKLSVQVGG